MDSVSDILAFRLAGIDSERRSLNELTALESHRRAVTQPTEQ
jgi:hypothetical protein